MYEFKFSKVQFEVLINKAGRIPKYKSSAIRGGMGNMLLQQNCVWDSKKCTECYLKQKCIVQNIMYAKYKIKPDFVTEESMGYVLDCDDYREKFDIGDKLIFEITLFGECISYFTPILYALTSLGMSGIGYENITFIIEKVRNRHGEEILSNGIINMKNVEIENMNSYIDERKADSEFEGIIKFKTPATIKYHGEFIREFHPQAIMEHIYRRVYMINCFEGYNVNECKRNWEGELPYSQNSYNVAVKRHSNAKESTMLLHGLMGEIEMSGLTEEFIDLILAGEVLHIGKNTRFGFGKYILY